MDTQSVSTLVPDFFVKPEAWRRSGLRLRGAQEAAWRLRGLWRSSQQSLRRCFWKLGPSRSSQSIPAGVRLREALGCTSRCVRPEVVSRISIADAKMLPMCVAISIAGSIQVAGSCVTRFRAGVDADSWRFGRSQGEGFSVPNVPGNVVRIGGLPCEIIPLHSTVAQIACKTGVPPAIGKTRHAPLRPIAFRVWNRFLGYYSSLSQSERLMPQDPKQATVSALRLTCPVISATGIIPGPWKLRSS